MTKTKMRNSNKKVIVAGHICIDITPVFPDLSRRENIDHILTPGKLIQMNGVDIHTGGCVANTGLAMQKLGADVTLMGKIGKDEFGSMIIQILQKQGYKGTEDMIQSNGCNTSYSVVIAPPGIDRIFLHDPGANDTFRYEDIDFDKVRDASLFHFGYPTIMRQMYQNDGEELYKIIKKVKELNVITSLDMSSIDPDSDAGQADWKCILHKVLPYVDYFVPSVEELCFMLDRERYDEWKNRANGRDVTEILSIENDITPLANQLKNLGAHNILIKCGAPGMFYMDENGESGFEISFKPKRVVSATGAGDTSIAAFLTAILNNENMKSAVELAVAAGACCVEEIDALTGITTLEELKARVEKGWEKNVNQFK